MKKMSQSFLFVVSLRIGGFANQFLDTVLQCCPTILVRFSQLDAHFSCRFPEFGRGEGNFFEKKQNKSCCFLSECFQFPRSQFPIGRDFFVFCSCWQNGNCTHFHSFPHYTNVPPCVPAGKTVQWTIFRAQVHPRPDWPEKGLYHPLRGWLMHHASACIRLAGTGR